MSHVPRRELLGYETIAYLLPIGVGTCIAGVTMPGDWLSFIRWFFGLFGFVLASSTFILLILQISIDLDIHVTDVDIVRAQYGLNLLTAHKEKKPEPPTPVTVFTEAEKGQFKIQRYANPPSERFLQYIFDTADKKNRRIAPEREAITFGKDAKLWTSTDVKTWFNILDERGITKKGYESETDNAWRQLTDNATLEKALYDFGHSAMPPTPLSVNPYVGHHV